MDSGYLQNYSLLDTVQDGETTYGIYARQNKLNHPFKNLTKRRGTSTIQLDMPRCFVTDLSFFTFFVFISFCCLLILSSGCWAACPAALCVALFVQANFIRNHGDKLAVRRFTAQVVDRVAEITV